MKNLVLTSLGVIALTLMSFTGNENKEKIIDVSENAITIKNTDKVSKEDLKVLSELVAGWTYCDQQSSRDSCHSRAHTFPVTDVERNTVQDIINKYNN